MQAHATAARTHAKRVARSASPSDSGVMRAFAIVATCAVYTETREEVSRLCQPWRRPVKRSSTRTPAPSSAVSARCCILVAPSSGSTRQHQMTAAKYASRVGQICASTAEERASAFPLYVDIQFLIVVAPFPLRMDERTDRLDSGYGRSRLHPSRRCGVAAVRRCAEVYPRCRASKKEREAKIRDKRNGDDKKKSEGKSGEREHETGAATLCAYLAKGI